MKKQPSSVFTLNGRPFAGVPLCSTSKRLMDFLDKLPDNELIDTRELAARLGYTYGTVQNQYGEPTLKVYTTVIRYPKRAKVWGNKRTIALLVKNAEAIA